MTVEELNVIITAQNTEFNRRLDEVNNRLDDMADTAQNASDKTYNIFRGLAGKLAALGIGKLIANSITEGMNSIESESLFETSLGKYADSVREWSESVGNALGLDDYTLRKNVGTLYTMTKNMGIAESSAASMSQEFALLAEDMASFYNISSDEAFAKLRSGLTGEAEPLKQLGILVDENTVKQYAYANGIAETGAELTQAQKVLARYKAIMAQTSTAQGDLSRTLDSPANQLRIIKNEVTVLMRDIGTSLMPTVSSLLSAANAGLQIISPIVRDVAEGVNSAAQALINASPQTKTMLTIALAAAVAIPAVTKATALLTAAKAAYNTVLTLLIPKQLTFAAALKATAGWIGIIAAAIGVISLINDINAQATDTTVEAADALSDEEANANSAADGVDNLTESVENLGKTTEKSLAAVDKLNIFKGGSVSSVSGLVSQADIDLLLDADDVLVDIQSKVGELSSGGVGDIFSSFREGWSDFWQDVGGAFDKFIRGDFAGGWADLEGAFECGLTDIDNLFRKHLGKWYEWWSDTLKNFGYGLANWGELWGNLGSGIYNATHADEIYKLELDGKYSDAVQSVQLATNDYLRQGLSAADALAKAESEYLTTPEALYYYQNLADNARSLEEVMEAEKQIDLQMQMAEYDYNPLDYYGANQIVGPMLVDFSNFEMPSSNQIVQNNVTVEIDGEELTAYVTSKESRTTEVSNGY